MPLKSHSGFSQHSPWALFFHQLLARGQRIQTRKNFDLDGSSVGGLEAFQKWIQLGGGGQSQEGSSKL